MHKDELPDKNLDLLLRVKEIENRILEIEVRNQRVEQAKAWEVSLTRRVSLVLITYTTMCLVFYLLGSQSFLKDACVPTVGYLLSTQTLLVVKQLWLYISLKTTGSTAQVSSNPM